MSDEQRKIQRYFRIVGALALIVLSIGATFYHFVEKLVWLDSIYFSVITLTTVGYGDITPKTNAGKIFTIFYVLIGIGIIGTFANLLIRNAAAKREKKLK
jgi:voltage-gated potassium channel